MDNIIIIIICVSAICTVVGSAGFLILDWKYGSLLCGMGLITGLGGTVYLDTNTDDTWKYVLLALILVVFGAYNVYRKIKK